MRPTPARFLRRKAGNVDKVFGFRDRLFVERRDPQRQRINKTVELVVRQSAVHVAVKLGKVTRNIVGSKQHFQRSSAADQTRQ